jgi:hypothetical protein
MRSERDSNPRGGLPHQPHFQAVRAGCRVGHRRALRIQSPIAEGTARQAKAPALGLRWDSDRVRLGYPVGARTPHLSEPRPSNPVRAAFAGVRPTLSCEGVGCRTASMGLLQKRWERLWSEHLGEECAGREPIEVVDNLWRPALSASAPHTRPLRPLPAISRRSARLKGPLKGLLVDG